MRPRGDSDRPQSGYAAMHRRQSNLPTDAGNALLSSHLVEAMHHLTEDADERAIYSEAQFSTINNRLRTIEGQVTDVGRVLQLFHSAMAELPSASAAPMKSMLAIIEYQINTLLHHAGPSDDSRDTTTAPLSSELNTLVAGVLSRKSGPVAAATSAAPSQTPQSDPSDSAAHRLPHSTTPADRSLSGCGGGTAVDVVSADPAGGAAPPLPHLRPASPLHPRSSARSAAQAASTSTTPPSAPSGGGSVSVSDPSPLSAMQPTATSAGGGGNPTGRAGEVTEVADVASALSRPQDKSSGGGSVRSPEVADSDGGVDVEKAEHGSISVVDAVRPASGMGGGHGGDQHWPASGPVPCTREAHVSDKITLPDAKSVSSVDVVLTAVVPGGAGAADQLIQPERGARRPPAVEVAAPYVDADATAVTAASVTSAEGGGANGRPSPSRSRGDHPFTRAGELAMHLQSAPLVSSGDGFATSFSAVRAPSTPRDTPPFAPRLQQPVHHMSGQQPDPPSRDESAGFSSPGSTRRQSAAAPGAVADAAGDGQSVRTHGASSTWTLHSAALGSLIDSPVSGGIDSGGVSTEPTVPSALAAGLLAPFAGALGPALSSGTHSSTDMRRRESPRAETRASASVTSGGGVATSIPAFVAPVSHELSIGASAHPFAAGSVMQAVAAAAAAAVAPANDAEAAKLVVAAATAALKAAAAATAAAPFIQSQTFALVGALEASARASLEAAAAAARVELLAQWQWALSASSARDVLSSVPSRARLRSALRGGGGGVRVSGVVGAQSEWGRTSLSDPVLRVSTALTHGQTPFTYTYIHGVPHARRTTRGQFGSLFARPPRSPALVDGCGTLESRATSSTFRSGAGASQSDFIRVAAPMTAGDGVDSRALEFGTDPTASVEAVTRSCPKGTAFPPPFMLWPVIGGGHGDGVDFASAATHSQFNTFNSFTRDGVPLRSLMHAMGSGGAQSGVAANRYSVPRECALVTPAWPGRRSRSTPADPSHPAREGPPTASRLCVWATEVVGDEDPSLSPRAVINPAAPLSQTRQSILVIGAPRAALVRGTAHHFPGAVASSSWPPACPPSSSTHAILASKRGSGHTGSGGDPPCGTGKPSSSSIAGVRAARVVPGALKNVDESAGSSAQSGRCRNFSADDGSGVGYSTLPPLPMPRAVHRRAQGSFHSTITRRPYGSDTSAIGMKGSKHSRSLPVARPYGLSDVLRVSSPSRRSGDDTQAGATASSPREESDSGPLVGKLENLVSQTAALLSEMQPAIAAIESILSPLTYDPAAAATGEQAGLGPTLSSLAAVLGGLKRLCDKPATATVRTPSNDTRRNSPPTTVTRAVESSRQQTASTRSWTPGAAKSGSAAVGVDLGVAGGGLSSMSGHHGAHSESSGGGGGGGTESLGSARAGGAADGKSRSEPLAGESEEARTENNGDGGVSTAPGGARGGGVAAAVMTDRSRATVSAITGADQTSAGDQMKRSACSGGAVSGGGERGEGASGGNEDGSIGSGSGGGTARTSGRTKSPVRGQRGSVEAGRIAAVERALVCSAAEQAALRALVTRLGEKITQAASDYNRGQSSGEGTDTGELRARAGGGELGEEEGGAEGTREGGGGRGGQAQATAAPSPLKGVARRLLEGAVGSAPGCVAGSGEVEAVGDAVTRLCVLVGDVEEKAGSGTTVCGWLAALEQRVATLEREVSVSAATAAPAGSHRAASEGGKPPYGADYSQRGGGSVEHPHPATAGSSRGVGAASAPDGPAGGTDGGVADRDPYFTSLAGSTSGLSAVTHDGQNVRTAVEVVQRDVNLLRDEVDALRGSVTAEIAGAVSSISDLRYMMETAVSNVQEVAKECGFSSSSATQMCRAAKDVAADAQRCASASKSRLDDLSATMKEWADERSTEAAVTKALNATVETFTTRLSAVDAKVCTVVGRVSSLEAQVGGVDGRVESLSGRVAEAVVAARNAVSVAEGGRYATVDEVQKLSETLRVCKQDVSSATTQAQEASDASVACRKALSDVRRAIAEQEEQYRSLVDKISRTSTDVAGTREVSQRVAVEVRTLRGALEATDAAVTAYADRFERMKLRMKQCDEVAAAATIAADEAKHTVDTSVRTKLESLRRDTVSRLDALRLELLSRCDDTDASLVRGLSARQLSAAAAFGATPPQTPKRDGAVDGVGSGLMVPAVHQSASGGAFGLSGSGCGVVLGSPTAPAAVAAVLQSDITQLQEAIAALRTSTSSSARLLGQRVDEVCERFDAIDADRLSRHTNRSVRTAWEKQTEVAIAAAQDDASSALVVAREVKSAIKSVERRLGSESEAVNGVVASASTPARSPSAAVRHSVRESSGQGSPVSGASGGGGGGGGAADSRDPAVVASLAGGEVVGVASSEPSSAEIARLQADVDSLARAVASVTTRVDVQDSSMNDFASVTAALSQAADATATRLESLQVSVQQRSAALSEAVEVLGTCVKNMQPLLEQMQTAHASLAASVDGRFAVVLKDVATAKECAASVIARGGEGAARAGGAADGGPGVTAEYVKHTEATLGVHGELLRALNSHLQKVSREVATLSVQSSIAPTAPSAQASVGGVAVAPQETSTPVAPSTTTRASGPATAPRSSPPHNSAVDGTSASASRIRASHRRSTRSTAVPRSRRDAASRDDEDAPLVQPVEHLRDSASKPNSQPQRDAAAAPLSAMASDWSEGTGTGSDAECTCPPGQSAAPSSRASSVGDFVRGGGPVDAAVDRSRGSVSASRGHYRDTAPRRVRDPSASVPSHRRRDAAVCYSSQSDTQAESSVFAQRRRPARNTHHRRLPLADERLDETVAEAAERCAIADTVALAMRAVRRQERRKR